SEEIRLGCNRFKSQFRFVLISKWLSEIPWSKGTFDTLDIDKTRSQLEEDHYGLET
ncbi:15404_t:CDS:2, partial [Gigaspora rosea]